MYNSVLEDRTGLPVCMAFILLRPAAFLRAYTGVYERHWPGSHGPYPSVRVRRGAGVGIAAGPTACRRRDVALGPIGAVTEADVPRVLREMKTRLGKRVRKTLADQLWTSTYVLLGLRYEEAVYSPLFEEVLGMEESTTYQAIIRKGKIAGAIEELQKTILRLGEARFQRIPNKKAYATLMAIQDIEPLEQLTLRLLTVETWEELLGLPEPRRGR